MPTQKEMIKEAMQAIAQRKPGRNKLVYDKATKTIVAVSAAAPGSKPMGSEQGLSTQGADVMSKHWRYLWYVLRHKWFVFIECCKIGMPLRGLFHDWSKFLPDEWFPYANYFYGRKAPERRDETGYYKPYDTGDERFDFAWLLHQKRNRHHWQWWVLPKDEGGLHLMPMTEKALRAMIADWRGAGRAQGFGDNTGSWYRAHKDVMQLHPCTRASVEWWLKEPAGTEGTG